MVFVYFSSLFSVSSSSLVSLSDLLCFGAFPMPVVRWRSCRLCFSTNPSPNVKMENLLLTKTHPHSSPHRISSHNMPHLCPCLNLLSSRSIEKVLFLLRFRIEPFDGGRLIRWLCRRYGRRCTAPRRLFSHVRLGVHTSAGADVSVAIGPDGGIARSEPRRRGGAVLARQLTGIQQTEGSGTALRVPKRSLAG